MPDLTRTGNPRHGGRRGAAGRVGGGRRAEVRGRRGTADLSLRDGAEQGARDRGRLGQAGDHQGAADLQGAGRRLDAAQPRRHPRAALARHRRRVGVRRQGPRPDHRDRSRRDLRDQRLRPRRRLVLPARARPHAPGARAGRGPLHPDLRRRRLLRVRHVQQHRLAGATRRRRCSRRRSGLPASAFAQFPKKELYIVQGASRPRPRRCTSRPRKLAP